MSRENESMNRVTYSEEIADEICAQLADGQSLRAICRAENMPNWRTVCRWMESNDDFASRCARARTLQADVLEAEMADIERDTLDGSVDPKAANVVLSSKRWRAAKLAPKKYGDRIHTELTGADGGPVQIDDTERAAKVAAILAHAQTRRDADASDLV
jgi:hypothetical protein